MRKYFLLLAVCVLVACEKPFVSDGDNEEVVVPGDGEPKGEVLLAENDTARFYLQGVEISGVVLTDCPTPLVLIENSHYRMPTKLEVFSVLRNVTLPDGYWKSGQRILCYDTPLDKKTQIGSTHFGTGNYYTYVPNGTIVKAGMKTNYCILPIRTEILNTQTGKITIDVNDQWND